MIKLTLRGRVQDRKVYVRLDDILDLLRQAQDDAVAGNSPELLFAFQSLEKSFLKFGIDVLKDALVK